MRIKPIPADDRRSAATGRDIAVATATCLLALAGFAHLASASPPPLPPAPTPAPTLPVLRPALPAGTYALDCGQAIPPAVCDETARYWNAKLPYRVTLSTNAHLPAPLETWAIRTGVPTLLSAAAEANLSGQTACAITLGHGYVNVNVLIHEVGHCLGLEDNPGLDYRGSMSYAHVHTDQPADLSPDDERYIRQLYGPQEV